MIAKAKNPFWALMLGSVFSVLRDEMEYKLPESISFDRVRPHTGSGFFFLFSVSSGFSFFLKKLCSRGKQFFLFSDPCSEVGDHSGFPSAS